MWLNAPVESGEEGQEAGKTEWEGRDDLDPWLLDWKRKQPEQPEQPLGDSRGSGAIVWPMPAKPFAA